MKIDWVSEFNYLGSQFSTEGTCELDVREMIKKWRARLREIAPVVKSNLLPIQSKKAIIESCILPTVYCGSKNWRTYEALIKKLEALHNMCTRTALDIDKREKVRMETISIGLSHPMDIVARRRLLFHVPLATGESQE